MPELPITIENGAGERLTFLRRVPGVTGERVEGEARVAPGAGPPMHVHFLQEECFAVVRGRIGCQRAGHPPEFAEAGATLRFPAGEPHRFWNAGEDELHCTAWIEPAGNAEFFLGALFASQRASGGRRPSLFDIAWLCRRYRAEYAILAVPRPVQAVLFPLVVAVGSLLGRYAKYAGAPAPLGGSGRGPGS